MNRPLSPIILSSMISSSAWFCLILVATPLFAGGSALTRIGYWPEHEPAIPTERFVAGELGVMDRTFNKNALFIAYRYLDGLGLSKSDQKSWIEGTSPRLPIRDEKNPLQSWLDARNAIPGAARQAYLFTDKSETVETGSDVRYLSYNNCLDDAFRTAAATLKRYVDFFGAASDETKAWLDAQDLVFSNCNGGAAIPPPLEGEDRAYQVAAAHFYAGHYPEARRHFQAIAEDPSSRWNAIADYMVGRTLVREERFGDAELHFRALLEKPQTADLHASALGLIGHGRFRSQPAEQRRALALALTEETLPDNWRQHLADFLYLLDPKRVDVEDLESEIGLWIRVMRRPEKTGTELAVARWREQRSLPWLVAALTLVEATHDEAEELIRAATAIAESSPAYLTVNYHRYRLLADQGRLDVQRGALDHLLATVPMATADRNRFQTLRATVSLEVDEYFALEQQVPAELVYSDGAGHSRVNSYALAGWKPGAKYLTPKLTDLLNRGLTTAQWVDLVERGVVVPEQRRRVVLGAWTRAFALGDWGLFARIWPRVVQVAPELEEALRVYEATPEAERPFVAALTFLRFPGLRPNLDDGGGRSTPIAEIDALRDNWWCAGKDLLHGTSDPLPAFIDPPSIPASIDAGHAVERAELTALEAGPTHLGRLVLDWADAHRDDPRVPEALHRVVRATRFGCPGGGYIEVSRGAFQRLHQRYPASPWTAKTPYWFE